MTATAGPTLAAVSPADLALVRAARAWGDPGGAAAAAGIWARFAPAFRDRLIAAAESTARMTPELAWQTLLRDHAASSRFDPRRVHPSWFDRILAAESPAVRAAVLAHSPEPIRGILRRRSGLAAARPAAGLPPAVPPHPEALRWALTLWGERLVGDVAESPDDPPVVLALSQFGFRGLARLARVLGQAKLAFGLAGGPEADPFDPAVTRTRASDRVRVAFFRRTIGRADPRLVPLAWGDFASVGGDPRWRYATVGLITVARLLKGVDPHRSRWAIQHLPYPAARLLATLGGGDHVAASGLPPRAIRAWEDWVLEAAWARLLAEGRLGAAGAGVRS